MINPADLKGLTGGEKLRAIRKSMGLTQQGFADMVGIDRVIISKIETGSRVIGKWGIHAICEGLDLDESIFNESDKKDLSPNADDASSDPLSLLDVDEQILCIDDLTDFFKSASITSQFEHFLVKMFTAYSASPEYAERDIRERKIESRYFQSLWDLIKSVKEPFIRVGIAEN